MQDYRLYSRLDTVEAELQALKEYVKILSEQRNEQNKRIFELEQRVMEDDGK